MSVLQSVGTVQQYVPVGADTRTVTNLAGSTLYYRADTGTPVGPHDATLVTASNADGSLTATQSVTLSAGAWLVSAGQTAIQIVTNQTLTASNPPAGGTGATAGAYDTAAHRDALIASVTAVIADVASVKQALQAKGVL